MRSSYKPIYGVHFFTGCKKYWTHNRSIQLQRHHLGKKIYVYSGKTYFKCYVTSRKIGQKIGEFIITKKKAVGKLKKKTAAKRKSKSKSKAKAKAKKKKKK